MLAVGPRSARCTVQYCPAALFGRRTKIPNTRLRAVSLDEDNPRANTRSFILTDSETNRSGSPLHELSWARLASSHSVVECCGHVLDSKTLIHAMLGYLRRRAYFTHTLIADHIYFYFPSCAVASLPWTLRTVRKRFRAGSDISFRNVHTISSQLSSTSRCNNRALRLPRGLFSGRRRRAFDRSLQDH